MTPTFRKAAPGQAGRPAFRKSALPLLLAFTSVLAGCATAQKPPEISYDDAMPAVQTADPPAPFGWWNCRSCCRCPAS